MGWILGLTGGAGSGKSTAAAILAAMGCPVVDADQISRALTASGGEAMPAIIRVFGSDMAASDGALDRPKMRELVFRDKDARKKLEAIVHAKLALRVDHLLYEVHKDAPVVIYDCPLLIESPAARERADRILVMRRKPFRLKGSGPVRDSLPKPRSAFLPPKRRAVNGFSLLTTSS